MPTAVVPWVLSPAARRARRGQCRSCLRTRDVHTASRSGGGTYRRGGRSYRSSICAACALQLLRGAGVHAGATTDRWSVTSLDSIVSTLGTEEAAEVFTAHRERRAQRRWIEEASWVGATCYCRRLYHDTRAAHVWQSEGCTAPRPM